MEQLGRWQRIPIYPFTQVPLVLIACISVIPVLQLRTDTDIRLPTEVLLTEVRSLFRFL